MLFYDEVLQKDRFCHINSASYHRFTLNNRSFAGYFELSSYHFDELGRGMIDMLHKLGLGFRLRCPHCGEGHISKGLFSLRDVCEVCHVRYERKSGESAGASMIWVGLLPIISLMFYFALYSTNKNLSLEMQIGVTMTFTVIIGLIGYRHAKGIWIAVVELSDGLKTDAEFEQVRS